MIRIYKLKEVDKNLIGYINQTVSYWYPTTLDLKVVANYSNKGNLKGLSVYHKGSKSLKLYFDYIKREITFFKRNKIHKIYYF